MVTLCSFIGFAGLFIHPLVYAYGYMGGIFSALVLSIYLPSLFIYKLSQVNDKAMKSNNEESKTATSKSKSSSSSTTKSSEAMANKTILTVIRKCIILTISNLISTGSIFICVLLATFVYGDNFNLLIVWAYTLILDLHSNFICVMLSNSFYDKHYKKLCHGIERCAFDGLLCLGNRNAPIVSRVGSVSPQNGPEMELSSYMESTQTDAVQNQMDKLDLDQNEEVP